MRFECQQGCTKCCTRRGWVYLTEVDLINAAAYLGMTAARFEALYVIRYRYVLRLRRPPRGRETCQFLTNDGCSIHPAKPTQCRTYPFWPSIVRNRAMWKLEGTFCPGIGKGPFVQIEMARSVAAELPAAYPNLASF